MNKTQIFKSYLEFLNREDKELNGVSEDFAKENPNYEKDNETNGRKMPPLRFNNGRRIFLITNSPTINTMSKEILKELVEINKAELSEGQFAAKIHRLAKKAEQILSSEPRGEEVAFKLFKKYINDTAKELIMPEAVKRIWEEGISSEVRAFKYAFAAQFSPPPIDNIVEVIYSTMLSEKYSNSETAHEDATIIASALQPYLKEGWIKYDKDNKDTWPEDNSYVLAYFYYGDRHSVEIEKYDNGFESDFITHWQPLPTPPSQHI